MEHRMRQQAAVAEFGSRALREDDVERLMTAAAETVAGNLSADYCCVLELLPGGEQLLARAGTGWSREVLGRMTVGAGSDSQAGFTLASAAPVIIDDLSRETRFKVPTLFLEQGLVSGLSVIIYGRDQPFGVLGAHTPSRRTFNEHDVSFVQSVANILGAAIERQRSEEARCEAEARYREIVENAPDGIFQTTLDGRFSYANNALAKMLGYASPEELVESISDIATQLYADHRQRAELVGLLRERGKVKGFEVRVRRKDGSIIWVSANIRVVNGNGGEPSGFKGIVEDITDRKKAEEDLSRSERQYRALVETSPDAILLLDEEMRVRMCNRRAAELAGLSRPGNLTGKSITEFLTPASVQRAMDAAMVILSGKSVENLEFDLVAADGREVPVEASGALMELPETGEKRIIGFVRDISPRKETESALVASEARLIEAQRLAHLGSWEWEVATEELIWTDELYHIFGFDPSDSDDLYARFLAAIHPEDQDRFLKTMKEDLERDSTRDMDFRIIRPDGAERLVSGSAEIVHGDGGPDRMAVKMRGTIQDITEQRRAEQELRLLQIITMAVNETDDLNSALEVTLQKVCELTGWTLGEAWVPDSGGKHLECSPAWHGGAVEMREFREASCQYVFPDGVGLPGRVWASKRPEWIADVTEDGKFLRSEYAKKAGLKAAVAIPVLMKDEVVAVMDFFVREPRKEDSKFIELISSVAAQLGSVIIRKRAEEKVKDYNMLLNAISRTLLNFVSGIATAKVFEDLLYRLLVLTHSELGFIGEVEYEDGKLFLATRAFNSLRESRRRTDDGLAAPSRIEVAGDDPLIGRLFREQGPVIANGLDGGGEGLAALFGGHEPARSFLGVPFKSGDSITGMIGIADGESDFSEETVSFLHPLLVTCANVLEADRNDERRLMAERDLVESLQTLQLTFEGVVQALASTAESRDPYTAGHQQRVSNLAVDLAREMGLPPDQMEGLRVAGLLHDLGKMAVPVEILSKPGRINEHEFNIIKTHSEVSYEILKPVGFPWPVAEMARQHHERLDGSGYPQGLKGEEISLEARILAVADVVEAMASHRPYRAARGIEAALEEVEGRKGELFDPEVVDACLTLFREKGYSLE